MSNTALYHCLTFEEWVKVTSTLCYSEVKVLYYLLSQNPMGDREVDCRIRTIANLMRLSAGAVSMALSKLSTLGFIGEVEVVKTKATIKPRLMSIRAQKLLAKQRSNSEHVDQPSEHVDQPSEHVDQPSEHVDQPSEHVDIYRSRAYDQTNSDLIQTSSTDSSISRTEEAMKSEERGEIEKGEEETESSSSTLDYALIEKSATLDKPADHKLDSHSEAQSPNNDEAIQPRDMAIEREGEPSTKDLLTRHEKTQYTVRPLSQALLPEGNVTEISCIDNYVDATCFTSSVEEFAGGICIKTPSTLDTQANDADISTSRNGANSLPGTTVDTGERVHDGSLSGGTVRGVVDEVLLGGKQVVSTMNSVNGYIHPTQKTEDRFRRKLHPWRYGFGENEYKEGFTKYLCDHHLSTCGRYKSNPPTVQDANLWIIKREITDIGLAEIRNHWVKYQKESQRIQCLPTSKSNLLSPTKKVQTLPEIEIARHNAEEAEKKKGADSVDYDPEEARARLKAHVDAALLKSQKPRKRHAVQY